MGSPPLKLLVGEVLGLEGKVYVSTVHPHTEHWLVSTWEVWHQYECGGGSGGAVMGPNLLPRAGPLSGTGRGSESGNGCSWLPSL